MADQFVITLKNEKIKGYINLGYVLAAINLIPFILFLFYQYAWLTGVIGIASTIIYFGIRFFIVKNKKEQHYIDENIFFVLAAVWLLESSLMAVLILLTGVLFKITLQPLQFVFANSSIQKDFFPRKEYQWNEMESVILKDGILTLNFKNHKLIQAPVERVTVEEAIAFNKFANEMLAQEAS